MHHLDCTGTGTGTGSQTPAVGVCAQRGAAVYQVHAELFEQLLTCTKPISRPVATEPPVRRLLCSTCATAHRVHAVWRPHTANVVRTS